MPTSSDTELLELFDHVWTRLGDRLRGLTDDEWAWRPAPADPDIGIRWRLDHIATTLRDPRNREWLSGAIGSASPTTTPPAQADSASAAVAALSASYADFRFVLARASATLDEPIGPAAGPFARSSRRSFAHHIADELIHHGAEVALLRDLYSHMAAR